MVSTTPRKSPQDGQTEPRAPQHMNQTRTFPRGCRRTGEVLVLRNEFRPPIVVGGPTEVIDSHTRLWALLSPTSSGTTRIVRTDRHSLREKSPNASTRHDGWPQARTGSHGRIACARMFSQQPEPPKR